MHFVGVEYLKSVISQGGFSAKMVFDQHGAIIFASSLQHSELKIEGISHEDDYAGNALAAMLTPGQVEIRFHRDFSDEQIARIMRELLADPALSPMRDWQVLYQGRAIDPGMHPMIGAEPADIHRSSFRAHRCRVNPNQTPSPSR